MTVWDEESGWARDRKKLAQPPRAQMRRGRAK